MSNCCRFVNVLFNGRRLNRRYQLIYQEWICFNKGKAYILIGHSIDNSLLRKLEKYYDGEKRGQEAFVIRRI